MAQEPIAGPDAHAERLAVRSRDPAGLAASADAACFRELYRTYLPAVYRYAYARTGVRQDAEDVTALAFERAWIGFVRYRDTGAARAWLFTIARRALADHYRRRAPIAAPLSDTLRDATPGPEALALQTAEIRQIQRLVGALGPVQREVIALRFFAELPYAEIARVLGKRESAVKMLAYRALEEIRRRDPDAAS
ncbi:MAG: sigma-70 family RNA polymerase sigma factor [Chloroflexota bacterium]|nr:sigma-70 family RNA polymerase sigma factor [Chloroflexota bacterium]